MNDRTGTLRSAVLVATCILVGNILLAPVSAHVNETFKHLWKIHVKPKLSKEGTINSKKNPVSWTRLKHVPAGLADGVDDGDGGSGDISAVLPGLGLTGGGESGDVTLGANPDVLQQRVTEGCEPGRSIRSIDASGAVICEFDTSTSAITGVRPHFDMSKFQLSSVGDLNLGAGRYLILASVQIDYPSSKPGPYSATCVLKAGSETEYGRVAAVGDTQYDFLTFHMIHHLQAAGKISILCEDHTALGTTEGRVRMTAIPLSNFFTVDVGGP